MPGKRAWALVLLAYSSYHAFVELFPGTVASTHFGSMAPSFLQQIRAVVIEGTRFYIEYLRPWCRKGCPLEKHQTIQPQKIIAVEMPIIHFARPLRFLPNENFVV